MAVRSSVTLAAMPPRATCLDGWRTNANTCRRAARLADGRRCRGGRQLGMGVGPRRLVGGARTAMRTRTNWWSGGRRVEAAWPWSDEPTPEARRSSVVEGMEPPFSFEDGREVKRRLTQNNSATRGSFPQITPPQSGPLTFIQRLWKLRGWQFAK